MPENDVLLQIKKVSSQHFAQMCRNIVAGMGFAGSDELTISSIQIAFQETITRRSTDGMFVTKESWLLAFTRPGIQPIAEGLEAIIQFAQSIETQNILTVVLGEANRQDVEKYHTNAKRVGLRSILLTGALAELLALDYAFRSTEKGAFSFAKLRKRMKQQSQEAAWRKQFLSLSALPVRVVEVHQNDNADDPTKPRDLQEILDTTDLFGVLYKTESFLLLGDPGGGKTTCLQNLAEELARSGGRTPVFLPLNRYEGNLLRDLGEALYGKVDVLSEKFVEDLLSSGALTVILDGLNEIQSRTLQPKLIDEINRLTHPNAPTSRSSWIVSCRRYDYTNIPQQLRYVNEHLWDLQPLTSDLIYQFLVTGLGKKDGDAVYFGLGSRMREICSNPLLLSMLFAVHKADNVPPSSRGILYSRFINLLLRRSANIPSYQNDLAELSSLFDTPLTLDEYCRLVFSVLPNLADEMQEQGITAIGLSEALDIFKHSSPFSSAKDADNAASRLSDSLLKRGILRYASGKISFFHHTIQEYFHASKLKNEPLDVLIPSYGYVQGAKRESIIFLGSLIDSPDELKALIQRVLGDYLWGSGDALLAYEIMQGASVSVDEQTQLLIAKGMWHNVTSAGIYLGANKRLAIIFRNISKHFGKSIEDLARDILSPVSENDFATALFKFYQEIDDQDAQRRLLFAVTLQADEDIPDDLLFRTGITAYNLRQYEEAIALYTQCISRDPKDAASYSNRALAYQMLGNYEKAEQDFQAALAISPKLVLGRTNYANLLLLKGQEDKAIIELQIAVENNQSYYGSHFTLGKLLVAKDATQALFYLEKASNLAADDAEKTECLHELLTLQEKLGRHAGAMISLKRLIDLNPTAWEMRTWKEKFSRIRLAYTEEQKRFPTVKAVEEGGEVALSALAVAVLRAAGWQIDYATMYWLRAVSDMSERVTPLPIILLDVPRLTETLVRERIHALQNEEKEIKNIVLLTTAETIEQQARIHLAQYPYPVTFITAVELRQALLNGNQACFDLFAQALSRAAERRNPFWYTKSIQESSEFFGRGELITSFAQLIRHHELVAIYGIHKIGKTSLLHQVLQYLTVYPREITSIWIEMSAAIKTPSDLYSKILRNLPGERGTYRDIVSAEDFQQELYAFHKRKLDDHPGHQILLILDEYPYLIPGRSGGKGITDYLEILGLFKILAQERWFNFLPCGRTSALSRVHSWREGENPLIGMIQGHFLGPLNGEETEELVKVLGQKAHLEFTKEAIARIFTLTAGHPFFTRTLGSWISKNIQKKMWGWSPSPFTVDLFVVDDAVEAYLRSGDDRALLSKIYQEELELEEQRIVKILAMNNRPLPRIALFPDNAPKERRRSIAQAIDNLRATSVLREDEQGHFSHRYELLRRVIIKDMEDEGDEGDDLLT